MKRFNVQLAVGFFLLLGVASLSFLAIRMGDVGLAPEGAYPIKARFVSISGLKQGASVELAGVRVGKVVEIHLDPREYAAEIVMAIDERVRLQEDAIASIRTQGIIGDKFVKITPGGSETYLGAGDMLFETEPSISLEELISKYIFESGN